MSSGSDSLRRAAIACQSDCAMRKTQAAEAKQRPGKSGELLGRLHPRLATWFRQTYPALTHAQTLSLPSILDRESILLTSPTGSGKTLAAFLGIFDALLRTLDAGSLGQGVRCIYVSPLRALAYDIGKNISAPIFGMGLEKELRIHLRTGDTPASERTKFRDRAAHILITTPESLAVMLAQESYAVHLRDCEFVVVDELHSFAGNKRGADLTLSLERLERLCAGREGGLHRPRTSLPLRPGQAPRDLPAICRIGLSATAAPLETLARFLVGEGRQCRIA